MSYGPEAERAVGNAKIEAEYHLNASKARDPKSQIGSAYSDLEESIAIATKEAEELERRLEGVLSPRQVQSAERCGAEDATAVSPLCSSIRGDTDRIRRLTDLLRGIHQRLEL